MYCTQKVLRFIEAQAFLRSYDSAPLPPPYPSPASRLSLFLSLPVCRRLSLLTKRKGGVGVEPILIYNWHPRFTNLPFFLTVQYAFSMQTYPIDSWRVVACAIWLQCVQKQAQGF
jgi:hypothetical protein